MGQLHASALAWKPDIPLLPCGFEKVLIYICKGSSGSWQTDTCSICLCAKFHPDHEWRKTGDFTAFLASTLSLDKRTSGRWQVKLCDPSLTRAIPERFRDEFLMIKHDTNLRLLYIFSLLFWWCYIAWQRKKSESGKELQTFPYPTVSKVFPHSDALTAKLLAQTLPFKSVTEKKQTRNR